MEIVRSVEGCNELSLISESHRRHGQSAVRASFWQQTLKLLPQLGISLDTTDEVPFFTIFPGVRLSMSVVLIDIPIMVYMIMIYTVSGRKAASALSKSYGAQVEDKTQCKHESRNPFHTGSLLS